MKEPISKKANCNYSGSRGGSADNPVCFSDWAVGSSFHVEKQ